MSPSPGESRVQVRLTPRGGSDRIDGVADGVLRVRVAAPPVEGAANEALTRLLAKELKLPRQAVSVVGGATSRIKTVAIEGPDARVLATRWPGLEIR